MGQTRLVRSGPAEGRRRGAPDARRRAPEAEHARFLNWWHVDDGNRLGLEGELPAAQGAVVVDTLQRVTGSMSSMPGEEDPGYAEARRADALVALCSQRIAEDTDPDRATVVVHAEAGRRGRLGRRGRDRGGGRLHPETVRRLLCDARVQTVLEDEDGEPIRLGRLSREPSLKAMMRQLRYRDSECRFPGCGSRRFTRAHHVILVEGDGGTTDLDNLVLVCFFHHRLVHEAQLEDPERGRDGDVRWFQPDGRSHHASALARAGPRVVRRDAHRPGSVILMPE